MEEGEAVTLSGKCPDPDLDYGDNLTFVWSSNISGYIGTGDILTDVVLAPGIYELELTVMDQENESAVAVVILTVNGTALVAPPEEEDEGEDAGQGSDSSSATTDWSLFIVLIFVVAIIVAAFIVVRRRRRGTDGSLPSP